MSCGFEKENNGDAGCDLENTLLGFRFFGRASTLDTSLLQILGMHLAF